MVTVDQPMKLGKRTVQTVVEFPCPKCQKPFDEVEFAGYDYQFGFSCDDCGVVMEPTDAKDYAFDCLNRYTDNY